MLLLQKNFPAALAFPRLHNSGHVLLQQIQSAILTESLTWLPLKTVAGVPLISTADGSEAERERADTSWTFKKCIDSQASVLPKANQSWSNDLYFEKIVMGEVGGEHS